MASIVNRLLTLLIFQHNIYTCPDWYGYQATSYLWYLMGDLLTDIGLTTFLMHDKLRHMRCCAGGQPEASKTLQ